MSDYFDTMGIPIVQGRGFQPADAASPALVAVVNETFAKTFWKGQNPIGQRVRSGGARGTWLTVVGVAKDVKQGGVDQKTGTEIYGLIEQMGRLDPRVVNLPFSNVPFIINFVLRSSLPPAALSQAIEGVVHEADGTLPVVRLRDMDAVFAESMRRPTLVAQLIWLFAALALLLAAIGTYGVLSVMVAERRHEIGIRMALGADRSRVLVGIMRHGLLLTGTGVVIGLAGAFGLSRLIASLLFGVTPGRRPDDDRRRGAGSPRCRSGLSSARAARVATGSERGTESRLKSRYSRVRTGSSGPSIPAPVVVSRGFRSKLRYSARSATSGSTLVARRAGT